MLLAGGGQDGGGERRNRQRQAQGEHDDGRQDVADVGRAGVDPGEQGQPDTGDDGAEPHRQAGADALGQAAGPGRQGQHHDRDRHQGGARLEGREAHDPLELDRQQEEGAAEGAVDDERDGVGGAELA